MNWIMVLRCSLLVLLLFIYQEIKMRPGLETAIVKTRADKYYEVRDSLRLKRETLMLAYTRAREGAEKDSLIVQARKLFLNGLTGRLFPFWYGTPWAYYGYGDTPIVNSVACGYFVAILLRDIGAKVDVHNLGEGASGDMIHKLDAKQFIKEYWHIRVDLFYEKIRSEGDGLYVLGLDQHTGFLLCENGQLSMIDSNPYGVQRHDPNSSIWLVNSSIRMTGKISDDPAFLKKWLTGGEFN